MQTYSAMFEAVADSPMPARQRTLSFELQGEGNLPQVSVVRPSFHDTTTGKLLVAFKRLLAGLTSTAPLVLRNTGTIPAYISVELVRGGQSFSVHPHGSSADVLCVDGSSTTSHLPLVTSEIKAGGSGEFLVGFGPQEVGRHSGELQLRIKDNHFENMTILLVGESYQDDITIENIRGLGFDVAGFGSEEGEQESQSSGTCGAERFCTNVAPSVFGSLSLLYTHCTHFITVLSLTSSAVSHCVCASSPAQCSNVAQPPHVWGCPCGRVPPSVLHTH